MGDWEVKYTMGNKPSYINSRTPDEALQKLQAEIAALVQGKERTSYSHGLNDSKTTIYTVAEYKSSPKVFHEGDIQTVQWDDRASGRTKLLSCDVSSTNMRYEGFNNNQLAIKQIYDKGHWTNYYLAFYRDKNTNQINQIECSLRDKINTGSWTTREVELDEGEYLNKKGQTTSKYGMLRVIETENSKQTKILEYTDYDGDGKCDTDTRLFNGLGEKITSMRELRDMYAYNIPFGMQTVKSLPVMAKVSESK